MDSINSSKNEKYSEIAEKDLPLISSPAFTPTGDESSFIHNDIVNKSLDQSFKGQSHDSILKTFALIKNDIQQNISDETQAKQINDLVEYFLIEKLKDEQPDFLADLHEILDELFQKLSQDLGMAVDYNKEEIQSSKVCKAFFETFENILISKLKSQTVEIYHVDLPSIILVPYIQNIQDLVHSIGKAHLRQINDSFISNSEWEKYCKNNLQKLHQKSIVLFQPSEIKQSGIELHYSLSVLVAFSKASFTEGEYQYWLGRIQEFLEIMPETPEISNEIKDKLMENLRKNNNRKVRKEMASHQAEIFWTLCEIEEFSSFIFIIFCLLVFLSNCYCPSEGFRRQIYNPMDRQIFRKIVKTLKKIKLSSSYYSMTEFLTFEKLIIFENILARFLAENTFYEANQVNQNNFINFNDEEITEIDILKELKKKSHLIDIKQTLGNDQVKCLKKQRLFSLQCLTPERTNRHITICISGFLSEDDDQIESWDKLVSYCPYSKFYAIKWASEKKMTFGKNILKYVAYIVLSQMTPKILSSILELANIPVNELIECFSRAKNQSKLAGKVLALCLILRFPFFEHSVSLVGFSLGTTVVTSCIKQLYKFKAENVIHDVYFLGGAAHLPFQKIRKWTKRFGVINGRIINCHTNQDWVLKFYQISMKQSPIGLAPIILQDIKRKSGDEVIVSKRKKVENYNVSKILRSHFTYRKHFDKICQLINYQ